LDLNHKERKRARSFHHAAQLDGTLYKQFAGHMKLNLHDIGSTTQRWLCEKLPFLKDAHAERESTAICLPSCFYPLLTLHNTSLANTCHPTVTNTNLTNMRNLIREVVETTPLERKEQDATFLRTFVGRLPFWLRYGSPLSRANQDNLLLSAQFVRFQENESIARQGDKADKAYLILAGCVGVYTQDEKSVDVSSTTHLAMMP
jgi:hypothetical protein